jgi:hypothetical protein
MTVAIVPEVLGIETQIFEDTPMTDAEEKELVIVKTAIQTAYADKLERDLAIGAGLLRIFRRKLYRGSKGGRNWPQWLKDESAELTSGRGPLGEDTAARLRGFYQFRVEVLQASATWRKDLPFPGSPAQVRPLLSQLETHPSAALEIWKAACGQAGKGRVPTLDQVNRAAMAYKANEANEARRLSSARQAALQKAVLASVASRLSNDAVAAAYQQSNPQQYLEDVKGMANHVAREDGQPLPYPKASASPVVIPAWELDKEDGDLDANAECKRITSAITDAHKAIGLLRGILYSQINKHGSDYLGVLRQVDAGVYSLHSIDDQIQQMADDIAFISGLLIADVGEGELAQSTIDVSAMPTRA